MFEYVYATHRLLHISRFYLFCFPCFYILIIFLDQKSGL